MEKEGRNQSLFDFFIIFSVLNSGKDVESARVCEIVSSSFWCLHNEGNSAKQGRIQDLKCTINECSFRKNT